MDSGPRHTAEGGGGGGGFYFSKFSYWDGYMKE